MLKTLITTSLLLFSAMCFGQELGECHKIIELTAQSIKEKSTQKIEAHLAEDFTMAGHQGEVAKMILAQLLTQLNDPLISYKEVSHELDDKVLKISCDFEYKERGATETIFLFDQDNKLKELDLFKMQVKSKMSGNKVESYSKEIKQIPFRTMGNLIALDVLVNGEEQTFILDTGAAEVILNAKYHEEKGPKKKTLSAGTKSVVGNISGMDLVEVSELDFAGIKLKEEQLITMDLGHLEEELGGEVHGLVGYSMIKDFDVLFDYDKKLLTLIPTSLFEDFSEQEFEMEAMSRYPLKMRGHIPVVEIGINEEIYQMGIDCGAEVNLLREGLYEKFKSDLREIQKEILTGAGKEDLQVKKGVIEEMTIGEKSFEKTETVFSDISHLNKDKELVIDGLIGYEILSKQKTILSFSRKEIIFIE